MAIQEVASMFPFAEGKRAVTKDVDGPTSYPAATGQLLNASDFGISVIEGAIVSNPVVTNGGGQTHKILDWPVSPSEGANPHRPPASQGATQIRLRWYTIAGTEVADTTNISGQFVRVTVF